MGLKRDAFKRMMGSDDGRESVSEEKEQAEPRPILECGADDCVFHRKHVGPAHCSHAAPKFKTTKSHKRRQFAIAGCMSYEQNPNLVDLEGADAVTKGSRIMAEMETLFESEN